MRVTGRLADASGRPQGGLTVRLFDKELRGVKLLGTTLSDGSGRYEIRYDKKQLTRERKTRAHLIVEVDGASPFRAPVAFRADEDATVDVTLPRTFKPGALFNRIEAAVLPRIKEAGVAVADLDEVPDDPDVSLLASETGFAPEELTHFVVAHRLNKLSTVPAPLFFALLRTGAYVKLDMARLHAVRLFVDLKTPLEDLWRDTAMLSDKELAASMDDAVANGVVSPSVLKTLPALQKTAKPERDAKVRADRQSGKRAIQTLLERAAAASPGPAGRAVSADHLGALPALLEQLTSLAVQAKGSAKGRSTPELQELLTSGRDLLDEALGSRAKPDPDAIASVFSAGIDGKAGADRQAQSKKGARTKSARTNQRRAMRAAAKEFPTRTFAAALSGSKNAGALTEIVKAHPDFDLRTTSIERFMSKRRIADGASPQAREDLKQSLKRAQRLHRLTHDGQHARVLEKLNLTTAFDVVGAGRAQVVAKLKAEGVAEREAVAIFDRAERIHVGAALLSGEVRALSGSYDASAAVATVQQAATARWQADFPNLKALFQQQDLCRCPWCRSVHGPAAYVADVLQFLKKRFVIDTTIAAAPPSRTAKTALFERRADIGEIDLNCDNALVAIPHIDVVNELLEALISPEAGLAYNGPVAAGVVPAPLQQLLDTNHLPLGEQAAVSGPVAGNHWYVRGKLGTYKLIPLNPGPGFTLHRTRQTHGTKEERDAAPEYVNQAAYTLLAGSKAAFTLPFDAPHHELQALVDRFDVDRADLMRLFAVGATPAARSISAQQLRLPRVVADLIVTADAGNQHLYWTTAVGGAVATYKVVSTLLDRTGLTYEQLDDLLKIRFIDPAGNLFIRSLDNTCDTAMKEVANLDAAALDRIHRFLRLTRATELTFQELNLAIRFDAAAAALGNLDDAAFTRLASVARVARRLEVRLADVLLIYGPGKDGWPAATHTAVFANPANGVGVAALTAKALADNEALPPAGRTKIAAVTDIVSVAIGATKADLDVLRAMLADDDLTAARLVQLYGAAKLLKWTGLKAADYRALVTLSGVNPLSDPGATWTFLDRASVMTAAALSPDALRRMLTFDAAAPNPNIPADAAITALLVDLQKLQAAARANSASPFVAGASIAENTDAMLQLLARLPGLAPQDLSAFGALARNRWIGPELPATFLDRTLTAHVTAAQLNTIKAAWVAVAAAPANADEPARTTLVQEISAAVATSVETASRRSAVASVLIKALKSDADTIGALVDGARVKQVAAVAADTISTVLRNDALITPAAALPAVTAAAFPNQFAAVRLAFAIAGAAQALHLTVEHLRWLLANAAAAGAIELDRLPTAAGQAAVPFASLVRWLRLRRLADAYPPARNPSIGGADVSLLDVIAEAANGVAVATVMSRLALVTAWEATQISALDLRFGWSAAGPASFADPDVLERLERTIGILHSMRASVADVARLIRDTPDFTDCATARTLLRARYEASDWLAVQKRIMDIQRAARRDALVAYLVANDARFTSAGDLYDFLLIDTQMAPCQPTSRLVQAHGTLQIFIDRCLMGIEPATVADTAADLGWAQWSWMANYRVWEANRKVFLYPENWIEPELRDDKSVFFKELENDLAQNELTERLAEEAAQTYLQKLDEVAYLEPLAMHFDPLTGTSHVFARTKGGDPAAYYYRRFRKEREWSAWEKVDLEISGDHLLTFIRNRRLYLAWPVLEEEAEQKENVPIPVDGGGDAESANKRLRIKLAISEYNGKKWLPKKLSSDSLIAGGWAKTTIPPSELHFVPLDLKAAGFYVMVTRIGKAWEQYYGAFAVTGCKGYPEPSRLYDNEQTFVFLPYFKDTERRGNRPAEIGSDSTNDFAIQTLPFSYWMTPLFGNTPDGNGSSSIATAGPTSATFLVMHSQQMTALDRLLTLIWLFVSTSFQLSDRRYTLPVMLGTFLPHFFQDRERVYAVVPVLERRVDGAAEPVRLTASDVIPIFELFVGRLEFHWAATIGAGGSFIAFLIALAGDADFIDALDDVLDLFAYRAGYVVSNAFHPLVCPLRRILNENGLRGLMSRESQLMQTGFDFSLPGAYAPTSAVFAPYPVEDVDFTRSGAYALYNWELFFHMPFLIAVRLMKNQRFEESMRWFHYIFDPTGSQGGTAPQKYWITRPFYERQAASYAEQRIEDILYRTAADPAGTTLGEIADAIEDWRESPFNPHMIARSRTTAFQKAVVIKYIEMLMAWGDSLFRQETMESITRASQFYALAEKLLGPKPRFVPAVAEPRPATFVELEDSLDLFSNALIEFENLVPDPSALPERGAELPPVPQTLTSLYFCVPPNQRLLDMWDTLADRQLKIRTCKTIDGAERTLALFAPPIDPGALVRAAAAGLSISSVVAGFGAPLPPYRFESLLPRAVDLLQELRTLGGALLSALEKRDAEDLSLLRSQLELVLLDRVTAIKKLQVDEAIEQRKVLDRQLESIQTRIAYYRSRKPVSELEIVALVLQGVSGIMQGVAAGLGVAAGVVNLLPNFNIGLSGFGGSPQVTVQWGSSNIAGGLSSFGGAMGSLGGAMGTAGAMVATMAGYERRMDEWRFQGDLADREIKQVNQQIVASKIRESILRREEANHLTQMDNTRTTDAFMRSKFTNRELYEWMAGEISAVYFQAYTMAFQIAKKAERCYQHELGVSDTFIEYGTWDSLRKGLGSADRLMHQVRRMEQAWYDSNKRELELTKHVSLAALDPVALLDLRTNGTCTVTVPEVAFDVDYPGHYMRRLKSVAVTIPCVAGPHTTVACKLTLVANRYRQRPTAANAAAYPENNGLDDRFVYNVGGVQSIATSQAQNDSGLFDVNLRDERWLPFERCGAIGTWRIDLGSDFRSFDRKTVTDVVLHLRYTARDGGSGLRQAAAGATRDLANQLATAASTAGLLRLIDVKHEMPDAWRRLTSAGSAPLLVEKAMLPFLAELRSATVTHAWIIAKAAGNNPAYPYTIDGAAFSAAKDAMVSGLWSNALPQPLPIAIDTEFTFAGGPVEALYVLVRYQLT